MLLVLAGILDLVELFRLGPGVWYHFKLYVHSATKFTPTPMSGESQRDHLADAYRDLGKTVPPNLTHFNRYDASINLYKRGGSLPGISFHGWNALLHSEKMTSTVLRKIYLNGAIDKDIVRLGAGEDPK
jgi:hypothetical protein